RLMSHSLGRRGSLLLMVAVSLAATTAAPAMAATPSQGTVSANSAGHGNTLNFKGSVHPGAESGSQDQGIGCFGADNKPAPTAVTGCDVFVMNVNVPSNFYKHFVGGPQVKIFNFGGGGV